MGREVGASLNTTLSASPLQVNKLWVWEMWLTFLPYGLGTHRHLTHGNEFLPVHAPVFVGQIPRLANFSSVIHQQLRKCRVGGSREGTGTYKQHQLGGGLDWGAAWKFLTLYTPWLAGLSSVPAKTAAVVLQKYGKRRIRMEMSSLMGCGLHPPFSMVGDSCHVHDCKFPASWHELNTSSDLMGLLILLTSFEFFHLSFSVSHPKF